MTSSDTPAQGQLAVNILHFARTLRAAGLPIGPGKVLDAIAAVRTTGLTQRDDFYWSLFTVFVNRRDQRELFDQAFHIFWRNPHWLERLLAAQLPEPLQETTPETTTELQQRLADALQSDMAAKADRSEIQIEQNAALTWSNQEVLQHKDFEHMSLAELAQAKQLLHCLRFNRDLARTRRFSLKPRGTHIDLRATLRKSLRSGADLMTLQKKIRQLRPPPLVLLCDISGSMSRYSRMLLHFAHAISNDRDRVFTFVFGTALTNITRQLRYKDVDLALKKVSAMVNDWDGGTSIGRCVHLFNRDWSRRVLAQGAIVLFISDGLDRDNSSGLGLEMERLHKSCRRLIWLNPLLRYDQYQPKAQGARAIMPHVDDCRTVHNLSSLLDLSAALIQPLANQRSKHHRTPQK